MKIIKINVLALYERKMDVSVKKIGPAKTKIGYINVR